MKAIVYTKYGSPDVLQLKEVEKPAPKADEVLVKVQAASVNPADWHLMRAEPFLARFANGLLKPKNTRLGADVAGGRARPAELHPSGMRQAVVLADEGQQVICCPDARLPRPVRRARPADAGRVVARARRKRQLLARHEGARDVRLAHRAIGVLNVATAGPR